MKLNLFFLASIATLQISCSKVNEETFVISGKVLEDCGGSPAKGLELVFTETSTNSAWLAPNTSSYESVYSGADGSFSIELSHGVGALLVVWCWDGGSYKSIGSLPAGQTVSELELVKNPSTDIEIYVNARDSLSDQDTLTFTNPSTKQEVRIPGPFTSTLVLEIVGMSYSITENPPQLRLKYDYGTEKTATVPYQLCDVTTVTMVVE